MLPRVLVVSSDERLRRILSLGLEREKYQVDQSTSLFENELSIISKKYDIFIYVTLSQTVDAIALDVGNIRKLSYIPIYVIGSFASEDEVVTLVEAGVDDCFQLPFNFRLVLAKIRLAISRYLRITDGIWEPISHTISLNRHDNLVRKNGEIVQLTPIETRLLSILLDNRNQIVGRKELYKRVWRIDESAGPNYLSIRIGSLRRKLEDNPTHPTLIQTIQGVGYLLRTKRDESDSF